MGSASGFENLESYADTGNVLVTSQSKLISVLFLDSKSQLVTVDSDCMMRVWDLHTGKQVTTLLLKQK